VVDDNDKLSRLSAPTFGYLSFEKEEKAMATCENCWNRSGGQENIYMHLIEKHKNSPCTPEEQAGEGADICPKCNRKSMHQYTKTCMNPDCV
jgi:hypothetical protein